MREVRRERGTPTPRNSGVPTECATERPISDSAVATVPRGRPVNALGYADAARAEGHKSQKKGEVAKNVGLCLLHSGLVWVEKR